MDKTKLLSLIQFSEKVDVEFKLAKNKLPSNIYETICAFNNRQGGHIILGVKDKNKEIIGVDTEYIDKIQKDFTTSINNPNNLYPTLYLTPEVFDIDGKMLIYIYVPEGKNVCTYKKEFFDRSYEGDINISKNQDLLYKLFARKKGASFVSKVYVNRGMESLDSLLIQRARKMALGKNKDHLWKDMSDEEILKSTRLIDKDEETGKEGLTLAAILLFGKDSVISSVLPAHKTDAIFRVQNIDRYDDRDIIITNLLDSYDRLMKFGAKHLNELFCMDGIYNVNARDKILREIFSNILAHRDYSSGFVAKFVIEKDKMFTENSSISNKIGILDLDNFKPVSKNPLISKIFREIGLADELGSGMRNTNKYTMMYSHTYPIFEEGDIFTTIIPLQEISTLKVGGGDKVAISGDKVVIKNDNSNIYTTDEQYDVIIKYAKENVDFRRNDIEFLLNIGESRARKLLDNLVKKDVLVKVGANRNRKYKLK